MVRRDAEQTAAQLIDEGWEVCHRFLVTASEAWRLQADERVALRLVQHLGGRRITYLFS